MANTWPFDYPKLPPFEERVTFVWRQFMDPCDAPITLWIQTLGPALLHALIAWYTVDLIQILRTMWKPPILGVRGRGVGHRSGIQRSRKRGLKSLLGKIIEFDPNAWVGNHLNPLGVYETYVLVPGEVLFWTAFDVAIVAAFYWSIIDIGSGLLYEWTSAISTSQYCRARDDAVLQATAPGYPLLGIFGWDAIGVLTPTKMRNVDFFNGFGVSQSVGSGVVSCSFDFENTGGGVGTPWIECRMSCLTGPRAGVYRERRLSEGAGLSGSGGTTYNMLPGEVWIGEIRVNGSYQIKNPVLFCHCRGTP